MPCRRCRSRGEECAYEDKKWRTKDHLRSEIERLRTEQRQGHAVIRALTNNDPQKWETVLDRMRERESPDSIAQWIHSTAALPSTPRNSTHMGFEDLRYDNSAPDCREMCCGLPDGSFSTPNYHRVGSRLSFPSPSPRSADRFFSADTSPTGHPPFQDPGVFPPGPASFYPGSSGRTPTRPGEHRGSMQSSASDSSQSTGQDFPIWTRVTSDTQLVRRLIVRVFASDSFCTPPLISRFRFMKDIHEGGRQYCSEALANALLGWSCKMLDASSQLISQVSFGDAFLGEAKMLLSGEQSLANIPSIQALGVLAWTEMGQGNGEEAYNLAQESVRSSIQLVLQTFPNQQDEGFRNAQALTYCGAFTLIRCVIISLFVPLF